MTPVRISCVVEDAIGPRHYEVSGVSFDAALQELWAQMGEALPMPALLIPVAGVAT